MVVSVDSIKKHIWAILTNTLSKVRQIHFETWTNTFCELIQIQRSAVNSKEVTGGRGIVVVNVDSMKNIFEQF